MRAIVPPLLNEEENDAEEEISENSEKWDNGMYLFFHRGKQKWERMGRKLMFPMMGLKETKFAKLMAPKTKVLKRVRHTYPEITLFTS